MTYTFTKEEIERFYQWSGVYEFELGLDEVDKQLVKKLGQVLQKPFEDMTNGKNAAHSIMKMIGIRLG